MTTEHEYLTVAKWKSRRKERQRLERLWWALVLIWAGLVYGADSLGIVPQVGGADAWSWTLAGAGMFGMLGALYRSASSSVPNPTTWDWVWASFCLIIGLADFVTLGLFWPVILILVGGVIVVSVLWRRA